MIKIKIKPFAVTLAIYFLLTLPIKAQEFTKPKFDISLSAFSLKEEALLSRGTSASVEVEFGYLINDRIKLNLRPVASFVSGQLTSRDPQNPLTNTIYLKEASVENSFSEHFKFKAGTLYQKDLLPGIAGHIKSFPSAAIFTPWQFLGNQVVELRAQASVPTSSGLATSNTEFESSSTLLSATLFLHSEWTNTFSTIFSASHFIFDHLSTSAATDSLQRGNTVIKLNSSSGRFVYKYDGNEFMAQFNYSPGTFLDIKFRSSYITNSSAPSDINSGYFYSIAPGFRIGPDAILRPMMERYHVESDAMVAVFSDTTIGRTNRKGERFGLALEKPEYQLQVFYAHSKLIQTNPFQSPDQAVFVNLNLLNIAF